MTQQDKELLLRYLSMASPYKVIVQVVKYGKCYDEREKKTTVDCKVVGINRYTLITDKDSVEHTYAKGYVSTPITVPIDDGDRKSLPYLRPLSSMTEEERTEINALIKKSRPSPYGKINLQGMDNLLYSVVVSSGFLIDWMLNKHFDIFDLIPKELAIAVTEENNPYNTREE